MAMATADKRSLARAAELKRFAFFGIAVSTLAITTAIIGIPLLCLYMQNTHSNVQDQLTYCQTRTQGIRSEFTKVSRLPCSRFIFSLLPTLGSL